MKNVIDKKLIKSFEKKYNCAYSYYNYDFGHYHTFIFSDNTFLFFREEEPLTVCTYEGSGYSTEFNIELMKDFIKIMESWSNGISAVC